MRQFRFHFILLVALLLAGGLPMEVLAQDNQRRVNRLREHEQKIREIIEARRQERAQQESEREEREARDPRPEPEEEGPSRAASSVVLGLRFMTEGGLSDYNMIVSEGESFITEVMMFNYDQNHVDRVRLSINYDKRFIEPIRVFDTTIRPYMEDEPRFVIDERRAVIAYDAELSDPLRIPEATLLRIGWRAVRPTPYTGIEFMFSMTESPTQYHTAIYVRGNNILGVANDPADGVISGGLMIEPEMPESGELILQGKAEELRDLYLGSVASDDNVGLILEGPDRPIKAGEEFLVHIALNNPHGALIDAISLFVKFDPDVLQVVDQDRFNWIRRGINIHDGPFHSSFPWDIHRNNLVRNDRGIITYQKALSNGGALPSERFATIRFRAVAPAMETAVYLIPGRQRDLYHTSVRYFGFERMNLTRDYSVPVRFFEILPAPYKEAKEPDGPRVEYVGAGPAAPRDSGNGSAIRPLMIERN